MNAVLALTKMQIATLVASVCMIVVAFRLGIKPEIVAPRRDRGQALNGTVWLVVAILAAIALIIFIVTHVQTKN